LIPKEQESDILKEFREGNFEKIIHILSKKPLGSLSDEELIVLFLSSFQLTGEEKIFRKVKEEIEKRGDDLSDLIAYISLKKAIAKRDIQESQRQFEKIPMDSPFYKESLELLASLLLQEKDFDGALRLLDKKRVEEYPRILYLIARAHLSLGQKEKFNSYGKKLIKDYPSSPFSLAIYDKLEDMEYEKGLLLYENGKFEEALEMLKRFGKKIDVLRCLYKMKKWKEFLEFFSRNESELKGEERREASYLKALIKIQKGKIESGISILSRLIESKDRWGEKSAFLLSYLFMKQRDKLEKFFRKFESRSRRIDFPYLHYRIGLFSIAIGDTSLALLHLRRAVSSEGFVKMASLYWLYKISGRAEYRDSLFSLYPFSYYSLLLGNKPSTKWRENIAQYHLSMREKALILLRTPFGLRELDSLISFALFSFKIGSYDFLIKNLKKSLGENAEKFLDERGLLFLLYPLYKFDEIKRVISKDVDPFLFVSLLREESLFDRFAVSPKGALGIGQLLLSTAKIEAKKIGIEFSDPLKLFDDNTNILLSLSHFQYLLRRYKREVYALAAYNAGSIPLRRWLESIGKFDDDLFVEFIPYEETRNYIRRILRSYLLYKSIYPH